MTVTAPDYNFRYSGIDARLSNAEAVKPLVLGADDQAIF